MALGTVMMVGFLGGAVVNSVVDAINVKKNCENANKMIESMNNMREFYNIISVDEEKFKSDVDDITVKLKENYNIHQAVIDDYLKNNNDRQRRTEIVLTTSLCIIIVNFIIKSNIFPRTYNYLFT